MKLLRRNEWFLHCNTGSLRKHKLYVSYVYRIAIKQLCVCKRLQQDHQGQHQASVQRKRQPTKSRQAFLSKPSLAPWKRKTRKLHLLCERTLFYPSSVNFYYLEFNYDYSILSFALVCLTKVCEHSVLLTIMKDSLLIVRVILRRCSIKTLILSSLRH